MRQEAREMSEGDGSYRLSFVLSRTTPWTREEVQQLWVSTTLPNYILIETHNME
jgi:hypothetical protein